MTPRTTVFVANGQKFGRLTVTDSDARLPSKNPARSGRRAPWVECECGTEKQVAIYDLVRGVVVSCGCHKEAIAEARIRTYNAEHEWDRDNASHHREFSTWQNIIHRCTRPTAPNWHRYGGRGISIHPEWRENPNKFFAYLDLNLGPRPRGMSLDRIDNDGNYEPGNLRWATIQQQQQNRECMKVRTNA